MGILVALQGLKDYWQYVVMAALLIIIVVLQSWNNSLRYDLISAKVAIEQYKAESAAQEKRYSIAEKEVKNLKKSQDEELKSITLEISKMPVNTPCDEAIIQGVKAARRNLK